MPALGCSEGSKGGAILRVPSQYGAPNHSEGAEKSPKCHKYFLQYSEFASERAQVRICGRQICFLPRTPHNLVTPLCQPEWKQREFQLRKRRTVLFSQNKSYEPEWGCCPGSPL